MIWQISIFVTTILIIVIVITSILFRVALKKQLKNTLLVGADYTLRHIEDRLAFLQEVTRRFSKNHFIVNGLIDPEGRAEYLPQLVRDFGNSREVRDVNIFDFEGTHIFSNNPVDHRLINPVYIRRVLVEGKGLVILEPDKRAYILEPIEFYNTPQGVVAVHLDLQHIVAGAMQEKDDMYYRLQMDNQQIYLLNYSKENSYYAIDYSSYSSTPILKQLNTGLTLGVLNSEFIRPIRNTILQLVLFAAIFVIISIFLCKVEMILS